MRTKAIILGAIAALTLATLTASAGTTATHRVQGSLVSLVATTTTVTKAADRDQVSVDVKTSTAVKTTNQPAEKPDIKTRPAAPLVTVPAACQNAINSLKALRQADMTEDAAERASLRPLSAAALLADRAEDVAEAQHWKEALIAAWTACLPRPAPACQAAITSLQLQLQAERTEELSELTQMPTQFDWWAEWFGLRPAFAAVAMACADRG